MTWTRVIFEHTVKTHAMPTEFVEDVVTEYEAEGIKLHPGFEGHAIQPVQLVSEFGFDLGGSAIMGRPFEVFLVDGLHFSLPSDEIQKFYEHWVGYGTQPVRLTRSGRRYRKLKGTGCLIVQPAEFDLLLHDMFDRIPAAEERSEAFLLEWTKRTKAIEHKHVTPEFAERLNSKRRGN